ncbi:streptomycin 6-kinase [Kribbella kalugense]|uniref:Streptomycin 6-kinase n=1 Tax=Kribbella kalugense TaxID=2512221 RepID=A0A4R7ZMN5_9ACTN|nr:streptomycin 6-kinase [Kribbella kalugense]
MPRYGFRVIELPKTFLEMPRWWTEGQAWLESLPRAVDEQCRRWNLAIAGPIAHGSNAIVVPVVRDCVELALRMSLPGDEITQHARALKWWDGRGMVQLWDDDAEAGAMLLERLSTPLTTRPIDEVIAILGQLMRRLAVPGPDDAQSTADLVTSWSAELEPQWERLGRPFDVAILREALDVAPTGTTSTAAVNGDFHSGQVLAGHREEWLTVDPVLYRGDIEFDLGRVLWWDLDKMTDIVPYFDIAVREAGLDRDRARDWVIWRTVGYWLWGLSTGLTEDPVRCARLVNALSR